MLRGMYRGAGILAAILLVATARAQELSPDQLAGRLQSAATRLTANPDPGALLNEWPGIAGDLVQLCAHQRAGRIPPGQAHRWAEPDGWTRLQGAWLLLYGGEGEPEAASALAHELGVAPATNLLAFHVALEAIAPRADGSLTLAASIAAARARLLPALQALDAKAAPPDDATVAARLRAAISWPALPRLARGLQVTGNYFHVVARADVPPPPAGSPLARAFWDVATAGPDGYAAKWRAHGILLDQFERIARREEAADLVPAFALTWPYYLLLCHAGAPITPFRPTERGEGGARLFHFADPPQEDQPLQSLFSRESHLLQVTILQGLLGRSAAAEYDPGRHIFMVPYDALAGGERWQIRSRRFGYLGYLDAFATREYPFILRPYVPEGGRP